MAVTPTTVDTYSRYMDALFNENEIISVSTVWQQFFGKPGNSGSKTIYSPDSEVIDIDIMRGQERIAALIHRGTDSRYLNKQKNTELERWSSFSRVFPFAEELGDITASQINRRVAGENPYEQRSKNERMRELARENHLEHIRRYVRLFEYLCGLSLMSGQHPAITGSANADNWYDFRRNAAHIVTPTVPWDNAAADILGDWDAAFDAGRENGHIRYNVAFGGGDVLKVILNDATIQKFADNRRFSFVFAGRDGFALPGNLQPLVEAGADPIAKITTPKGRTFYLFGYDAIWTDADGNPTNYMPVDDFFFAYYGARCDRYFGPNEVLPPTPADAAWYQQMFGMNMNAPMMPVNIKNPGGIVTPAMFYCDAYPSNDKKKVSIRTQTAPIFATTQTDAFFTYTDCLTVSS
ncbi:MAG: major capsid protein [Desulfobacteraceae bacterium]|jgi:hypothetical protein